MTGDDRAADGRDAAAGADRARTAVVETTHADDEAARTVAAALAPDNTADIGTTSEGATVRTRIERGTTGGLLASVDDYLVNLGVADDVAAAGRETDGTAAATGAADTNDADGIRDGRDGRTNAGRDADTADNDTHHT
ncbi:KEOPS complex subunit Pcc1 [Halobaculum lipolyticum]|uniref:KEOPS complex subunit Pcc1 n=1 Tax=Halobaculum lipolyticum TaxID=3032001 RepID=A0ABD5WCS7_9EURY|nr:KEOPS complex subunit Pcc1 [Halobaculum sp. DT31]